MGGAALRELLPDLPDSIIKAPRWWVALSGGADSVALLYALSAYRESIAGPPVSAIHVNHGLHPDAPSWAQTCQAHCDALSVPLHVTECTVASSGRGLEADARSARYQSFESVLGPEEVLFTAHHADDMVETVLLRLFRGAGPRGLAGIPQERACGHGRIFRPFLDQSAEALKAAVASAGLEYVLDPSNLEVRQDRNYLRQVVLPVVAERWPGYRETVRRAAGLQALARDRLAALPLPLGETRMGEPVLAIDPLLDAAGLAAQIHQWLGLLAVEAPDQRRLSELARQALTANGDRMPELVWREHCLRVWGGSLVKVSVPESHDDLPERVTVGESVAGRWGSLSWEPGSAGDALPRGAQLGLQTSAMLENLSFPHRPEKAANKWLREMRIPPWWRRDLLVLNDKNIPVWLLPVGALAGISTLNTPLADDGLVPVWRLARPV